MVVSFKEENTMTFKELFLKEYDEGSSDFAVYTQDDLYDQISYTIEKVRLTPCSSSSLPARHGS